MRKPSYLLFILLVFISCNSLNRNNSNNIIKKSIVEKLSEIHKDTLYISDRADNKYISSLYEENFADSVLYKMEMSRQWLAKKSGSDTMSDDTDIITAVFSRANYKHIKKQAGTYKWSKDKINKMSGLNPVILLKDDKSRLSLKPDLQISEPVYTINNKFALVSYTYKGSTTLVIFENRGSNWEQLKYIPLHST